MEWICVKDRLPADGERVLAICVNEKGTIYNMRHDGWFRNTIYSCRVNLEDFIIESHGPIIPATHWMEAPKLPENND